MLFYISNCCKALVLQTSPSPPGSALWGRRRSSGTTTGSVSGAVAASGGGPAGVPRVPGGVPVPGGELGGVCVAWRVSVSGGAHVPGGVPGGVHIPWRVPDPGEVYIR